MQEAAKTLKKITLELGRQVAQHRPGRRRSGCGGPRSAHRNFLQQRRSLRRRFALVCAGIGARCVPGKAAGPREENAGGRSAGSQDAVWAAELCNPVQERAVLYRCRKRQEGAKVVLGGEKADVGTGKGYFVKPTIFDAGDQPDANCARRNFWPGALHHHVSRMSTT